MLSGANSYSFPNGSEMAFPGQIFRDSPLGELQGLTELEVRQQYPRGSVLFVEGQGPRGVYILREGRAKVSIASSEGKTLVLPSDEAIETLARPSRRI